jgi:hypothetical protein
MTDRFADHPINPCAAGENVGAVEMLHFVQGNLAGGGCCGDRRISQGASFAQGEDSGWQTQFAHWGGDKIIRIPGQAQEAGAIVDAARSGGDLYGIDAAVAWRVHTSRQVRRALKVMYGKQDTRRHGIFPNGLAGELAQGFHFEIAPLAAGFAGLNQPVEFAVNAAGKLATAFAAAASGDECGVSVVIFAEPAKESGTFRVAAQPIEAQLDGPGMP